MIRSALVAVAVAALLAGCGGSGAGHGTATLWLTRDEGKTVLLVRSVPADESVLQALERSTKLTTRYGGRFVQSVNGLSGSIVARHDWFYFVNGVEGDRGAADYRLRAGDIAWWDYRDWGRSGMSVPAVVGAFPEPFVHGYGGKPRPTIVLGPKTAAVRRIARLVHSTQIAPAATTRVRGDVNTLTIRPATSTSFTADWHDGAAHFVYAGDPQRLLRDPSLYRHRYRLP
ncbi:MAG TPA: DUF4430 domain-containing protein [Gaiellaceae bacterium]